MGRSGILFKKKKLFSRFRVGDRVFGLNDGYGMYFLYKNVVNRVCITKEPAFVGDTYEGDFVGFQGDGSKGVWSNEDDLAYDDDYYNKATHTLAFGTNVEFQLDKRVANGQTIFDVPETWICGIIERVVRNKAYRIIHTKWDITDKSEGLTTSIVPFDRVRIKKENN